MRYLFCIAFNAVSCAVYCRDERFLRLSCLSCACETCCLIYYGEFVFLHLWLLVLLLILVLLLPLVLLPVMLLVMVLLLLWLVVLLCLVLLLWLVLMLLLWLVLRHLFGQLPLVHCAVPSLLVRLQSKRVDYLNPVGAQVPQAHLFQKTTHGVLGF